MSEASNRPGLAKARSVPLVRARAEELAAAAVETVLHARHDAGDAASSNRRLGTRLGVCERMLRDWREGSRAVPVWFVLALPVELADEILCSLRAALHAQRFELSLEQTERRIVSSVGALAGALDEALLDGLLDDAERALLARLLRKIETQAGAAAHQVLRSGTEG